MQSNFGLLFSAVLGGECSGVVGCLAFRIHTIVDLNTNHHMWRVVRAELPSYGSLLVIEDEADRSPTKDRDIVPEVSKERLP